MSEQSTRMTRKTVAKRRLATLPVVMPSQSLENSSLSENASSPPPSSSNNKKRKRESEVDDVMVLVNKLENSHLVYSSSRRRSSRLVSPSLTIDLSNPINKGKRGCITLRPSLGLDNDKDGHHEILSHIPFMRLLGLVDMAIKCETTGCLYDSDDNIVTYAIKELSLLPNSKDAEFTYRFRTHKTLHTKEYAAFLTGDEPLSELIPLLVYYIRAKGLDRLSDRVVTQLRELFIQRFKTIAAKTHLKKRRVYSGRIKFHTRDWTIYNNAYYEENDSTYDRELAQQGHTFHMREYDDQSDYYEE
jgi:hypothetical protein